MIAAAALLVGAAAALGAGPAGPGDFVLTLLPDTLPAASGGRCMDGSMDGYATLFPGLLGSPTSPHSTPLAPSDMIWLGPLRDLHI